MHASTTHRQIINSLGGATKLGKELKLPRERVALWKHRNNIPPYVWLQIAELSNGEISLDILAASYRTNKV